MNRVNTKKEFLKNMPKEMKVPKHWKKFLNEQAVESNLFIKHGNEYECTNCGKFFFSKQVEGCWEICPFCNNQYDVKRSNLKNYFFLYDVAVIDNINNKLVLRYFDVYRKYNKIKRRFEHDAVEYARVVPELGMELVNDRYVKIFWNENVKHTKKIKKWRVFTGQNGLNQYYRAIYLENINEKTKGTQYQYAPIKEAISYLGNKRIDGLNILKKARYPSFELLIKAGLYKLALECPEKFTEKGSFEKRFGVSKEFFPFMRENDISYNELQVLKLIKVPNIHIIQNLLKIVRSNIEDLEYVKQYVNLVKLHEYSKKQEEFYVVHYLDYIENMQKLGVPLTKKILFPEKFNEAHNLSVEKVEAVENKEINKKIKQRYKELYKNAYEDNVFFIRPAKDLKDMKEESKQQDNCVYKNYSEKYANGSTDIYFLRSLKNPEKSLVTVEVLNNKIRQKYQKKNKEVTAKQDAFLKMWSEKYLEKVA